MTRLDFCDVIPMTVQNIILEHLEAARVPRRRRDETLIGIASEMKAFGFEVVDKVKV